MRELGERLIQRAGSELEAHARILTKPLKKEIVQQKISLSDQFRSFLSDRLLAAKYSRKNSRSDS